MRVPALSIFAIHAGGRVVVLAPGVDEFTLPLVHATASEIAAPAVVPTRQIRGVARSTFLAPVG